MRFRESHLTHHLAVRKFNFVALMRSVRVGEMLCELHTARQKFFMLRSIFVRFTLTNVPLTWFNARTTQFISTDLRACEFGI